RRRRDRSDSASGRRLHRRPTAVHDARERDMRRRLWCTSMSMLLTMSTTAAAQTAARDAASRVNPFLSSVPSGEVSKAAAVLTLASAIERALAHNLGLLTSEQEVVHARGSRWHSLTGVLPASAVRVGHTTQTTNLAAFGFDPSLFPGIPSIV